MERPSNLVYVSSGLHTGGDASLKDVGWKEKRWCGIQAYSDSKLMNVLLSFAVARHWSDVASNSLSPGWVRTKMGGAGAPGSVKKGAELPIKLGGGDPKEIGTGKYYSSEGRNSLHPAANDEKVQEEFLRICEEVSGVPFPN